MKKVLLAALLGAAAFSASAIEVGVSVNIGAPNYYGAIDIGNYPPPQLINPNPIIIQPAIGVAVGPLYLRVPYAHSHNWRRYCGIYNACGRPVYFVHENWYNNVYGPRYRMDHGMHHDEFRHDEMHHPEMRHDEMRHEERHDERHDEHHDHDHEGR
jgi:hypothetical protein